MRLRFFVTGLLLLIVGSYLDNIRGPLLPFLTQKLLLRYSQSVWLFVAASLGAITLAGLYLRVVEKHGIRRAKYLGIGIGFTSNAASLWVTNEISLFVFAFLMGGAISSLGSLANLFVFQGTEERLRARAYSALHTMYGAASALGPLVVPAILNIGLAWQWVFLPSVLLLALLTLLPMREVPSSVNSVNTPRTSGQLSWSVIATFVVYVLSEVLTSMWMVALLVETKGFTIASASPYLTFFFIFIAFSRILCIIWPVTEKQERRILWGSQVIFVVCLILGTLVSPVALSIAGLVGPFFPFFMARVTRRFGLQSQGIMLRAFFAIPVSSAIVNFIYGQATRWVTLDKLFLINLVCAIATLPLLGWYLRLESCQNLAPGPIP